MLNVVVNYESEKLLTVNELEYNTIYLASGKFNEPAFFCFVVGPITNRCGEHLSKRSFIDVRNSKCNYDAEQMKHYRFQEVNATLTLDTQ